MTNMPPTLITLVLLLRNPNNLRVLTLMQFKIQEYLVLPNKHQTYKRALTLSLQVSNSKRRLKKQNR